MTRSSLPPGICLPLAERPGPGRCRACICGRFDGPFAQAQAVAATILQLLRQGFRYREIAVAAADDPAGRTVLQTVLRQYGIPAYFAGQRPLLQEPVFEMVLAALDAATGGLEREDVLRWLKSGLAGVARADVDLLENYALVWNISGQPLGV